MADFALLESTIFILRKIWMIEKSWNFHNVIWIYREISRTVSKIQDLSVTQILREIKFGEFTSSKNAVFAIFGALKMMWFLVNLENAIIHENPWKSLKCVLKNGSFWSFSFAEIGFTENLSNRKILHFHTVEYEVWQMFMYSVWHLVLQICRKIFRSTFLWN